MEEGRFDVLSDGRGRRESMVDWWLVVRDIVYKFEKNQVYYCS
jgi:hypothetical protein